MNAQRERLWDYFLSVGVRSWMANHPRTDLPYSVLRTISNDALVDADRRIDMIRVEALPDADYGVHVK